MPKITAFRPDATVPESYEVDAATVDSGTPQQGMTIMWRSPDGTSVAGVFRSTVGVFRADQYGDESTFVRKGHVIVTGDDGSSVECRPGDVLNIQRNTTCVFDVREDLEDYFVISNPEGVDL